MELNGTVSHFNENNIHSSTFNTTTTTTSLDSSSMECHVTENHIDDTFNSFAVHKTIANCKNENPTGNDDGQDDDYDEDFESEVDDVKNLKSV